MVEKAHISVIFPHSARPQAHTSHGVFYNTPGRHSSQSEVTKDQEKDLSETKGN